MRTITSKQTANEAAAEILKIINAFGKVTWNCMTFEKVDGSKIKVGRLVRKGDTHGNQRETRKRITSIAKRLE